MNRRRPRIAVFDYVIEPTSAMGGCQLRMLQGLCDTFDFTVFAVKFDNPRPDRIRFVRVPSPTRPAVATQVIFLCLSALLYYRHRLRDGVRFDLVERTETFTLPGQISYVHFCHRGYLRGHWRSSRQPGVRGALLSLDLFLRALVLEPILYRFTRALVVPSQGLAKELAHYYPFTQGKIHVIPNSADTARLQNVPADYDRETFRAQLGLTSDDMALIFIALGQFERKGFPELLEAVQLVGDRRVKLVVVGGSVHWKTEYGRRCDALGIRDQVLFQGMQTAIHPYLWAVDAFALPSKYETFSLVTLEAAAAGLPLLVTDLYGVQDYLRDGENGFLIEKDAASVADGIRRMLALSPVERSEMGKAAQQAVQAYSIAAFRQNWGRFLAAELSASSVPAPAGLRGA